MHTRAEWKELPDGNPRAARKSRERDLNHDTPVSETGVFFCVFCVKMSVFSIA